MRAPVTAWRASSIRFRQLALWMNENVAPVRSPSSSAARKVLAHTIRTAVARRAHDPVPSCRLVIARYGIVGTVITGQLDRFVEQGQAPHGPAAVEDPGGFPLDVGLGEDGFDDLAHLAVADHGVGVAVERQHRAVVGAGDGLPALDRLIARAAVGGQVGQGVDLGGDGVPVQPGEGAGLGPVTGVVGQDGAFAVPGHLADREHGFDVCWHASNSLRAWMDQDCVMTSCQAMSRAGHDGPAVTRGA